MTVHPCRRAWEFAAAPFVDRYQGVSLTRLLAAGIFALVVRIATTTHNITWTMFCCLLVAVAAAFGKSIFDHLLDRVTLGVSGSESIARSDTHVTIDETQRVITERRDHDLGIEPTP